MPVVGEAQMIFMSVETPEEAPAVRKIESGLDGWPSRSVGVSLGV